MSAGPPDQDCGVRTLRLANGRGVRLYPLKSTTLLPVTRGAGDYLETPRQKPPRRAGLAPSPDCPRPTAAQRQEPASTMTKIQESGDRVVANVERVIVGKHHEVQLALVALLCRGHLLIEDVPGTGKTVLAKAIAKSLGSSFRRIQFTPDLLPSDVTGLSIYNQKTQEFEFRPG